jgi:hypothetical protein
MNNYRFIALTAALIVVLGLMTGGFTTFAQFNVQKIGEEIKEDVAEAQGESISNMAEGMSQPAGTGTSAGTAEEGPVTFEEIPEDKLRDAIAAVNQYKAFADTASKKVRTYIKKIKVSEDSINAIFEPGTEPWLSDNAELRYSPFDAELAPHDIPDFQIKLQPPFLPPLGPVVEKLDIDILERVIFLRMITKQGGEFVAVAEIAGTSVELREGEQLLMPEQFRDISVTVQDISLNSVEFTSGGDSLVVYMGGAATSSEDFQISVGR